MTILALVPMRLTAVVVAVDIVPDINVPSSGTFIPLDLNGDGTADVRFIRNGTSAGFYAFPESHSRIQAVFSGDPGYYWTLDFARGQGIGPSPSGGSSWRYDPTIGNLMALCSDTFCLGYFWDYVETFTTKYLGLQFDLADGTHYGYVEIKGSYGSGTLVSMGYETSPGVPIAAGGVPEPGRTGSIALFLLALIQLRRRRCLAGSE